MALGDLIIAEKGAGARFEFGANESYEHSGASLYARLNHDLADKELSRW